MNLRFKLRNSFLAIKWSLYLFLLYTAIIIYKNHFIATIAGFTFFLIFFLPELFLHIKYYIINSNKIYKISSNSIIISDYINEIVINKDDIQGIKLKKPANLQDGWDVHLAGITCYYYLKVTLKSGEVYYFTNLLDPYIDKIFEQFGYKFYREKGIAWL